MNDFLWLEIDEENYNTLSDREKYQALIDWSRKARGRNPGVFDEVSQWILEEGQWTDEKLEANRKILMEDVIGRFRLQNTRLRAYLQPLKASGIVNEAVFAQLDRFDRELSGVPRDLRLREAVSSVFADFAAIKDRRIREQVAGGQTGSCGTDAVSFFGYMNFLKDCDASVQWALFMPQLVEKQQKGFHVTEFAYQTLPAMRFIGKEWIEHDASDKSYEIGIMKTLDTLQNYQTELTFDVFLQHHYGKCVDVGEWHGFWGRFMKADTPVPEGFVSFDFIPEDNLEEGPPYLSQFAYAAFEGDTAAMHRNEGFDADAMYDVTRNIILAQGVCIPYPDKYWTAEVFPNGVEHPGYAYLFSVKR